MFLQRSEAGKSFHLVRETTRNNISTVFWATGSLDRQTKPLMLASEIAGLSNLTAYLKSENYVVKFRFAPNPVRKKQPGSASASRVKGSVPM